jgi:ribosome-binding protein aMBF1 (putative translation factor)
VLRALGLTIHSEEDPRIGNTGSRESRYGGNMGQENARRPKSDADKADGRDDAAQDETRAFNSVVGEAIRRARQEHGWTQAFLAEQAGLSPNYIARLERGELGPSLFVAHRICEALSIDVDTLVSPAGAGTRRTGTKRRALPG